MLDDITIIQNGAEELSLSMSHEQASVLAKYLDQLEVTNRSLNLTRIPREQYASLHVLDSLTALRAIDAPQTSRIIDIGTGAGFPGVPLAVMLPQAQVTLLDSTAKKVRFCSSTCSDCGITNCIGLHARAEDLGKDRAHREQYDVVISRAVASFRTLIELMLPLTKVGGRAIALKGARVDEELLGVEKLVYELGGGTPVVEAVKVPGEETNHHLVIVEKIRPTPTRYPNHA